MNMYLYTYRLFWLLENEYLIGVCGVESNVTGIVATLSIDIMNQKRPDAVAKVTSLGLQFPISVF